MLCDNKQVGSREPANTCALGRSSPGLAPAATPENTMSRTRLNVKTLADLLGHTRTTPSGCLEWVRGRNAGGYGMVRYDGFTRPILAHRLAWFLVHGAFPKNFACHKCDNPPCCNPDHLFDGTQAGNVADSIAKGRQPRRKKPGVLKSARPCSHCQVNDRAPKVSFCSPCMATFTASQFI